MFNSHATVSPFCACGDAMALAISSHPWLALVWEEALCTHALLPEETKGTARTGRGCL